MNISSGRRETKEIAPVPIPSRALQRTSATGDPTHQKPFRRWEHVYHIGRQASTNQETILSRFNRYSVASEFTKSV